MNEQIIKEALYEAYKKAGGNAYFGSGFMAGVEFAKNNSFTDEVNRQITPTCLDSKNQNCAWFERREEDKNGYLNDFTCKHSSLCCCSDGVTFCNKK